MAIRVRMVSAAATCAAVVLSVAGPVRAADGVWIGAADGNWSDGANWLGGTYASGSGATAYFTNGAAVTVWQDLPSLTLGNLHVAGADVLFTNNAITLSSGAGTSVVTVEGPVTAFVSVALSPVAGTRLVKEGAGTFRLNRYLSNLSGLTLGGGTLYLGFPQNSDGLNVGTNTITVMAGATLRTGGANQINNQAVIDVRKGGAYDLGNITDNIGAITGAGDLTNASANILFWPGGVERVFSGAIYGSPTFEPRQAGLVAGSTGAYQNVSFNLYHAGTLAFAPGVGRFELGALYTTNDQVIALQDTLGNPITLALGTRNSGMTLRGSLTGPGGLEKAGTATLTLTNAHPYAGSTTVSGGTLALGDGVRDGALTNSSGITVLSGKTIAFNIQGDQAYERPLAGAGALTKTGAGALALNALSLTSGAVTVSGGSVAVNGGNSSGVTFTVNSGGGLQVSGGTLRGGSFTLNAGGQLVFSGGSSTGATLTANNGTSVEVSGGTHTFASTLCGNKVNRYVQTGGTAYFPMSEGMNNTNAVYAFVSGGTLNLGTLQPPRGLGLLASGSAVVNIAGLQRIASDGWGHTVIVTNNAFVNAPGGLQLMSVGGLASTCVVTLAGGTLATSALDNSHPNAISPAFVNFDGGLLRFLSSATLVANANSTFAVLAGGARIDSGTQQNQINQPLVNGTGGADGGLTKSGASVLVLATNATYTGQTTVKAGTLRTTSAAGAPFGTGNVFVNGGTLQAQPAGSGLAVSLSLAGGAAENTVTHGAGPSALSLSKMSDSSVTLTLGNSGAAAESVLVRTNRGVLAVIPASGTASLGSTEKVVVNGGVATVNGMVPAVFGVHNTDDRLPCDFLAYGANGFQAAAYTAGLGGGASSLANVTTNTVSDSAQVYALRVTGSSLRMNAGQTLTVGDGVHPAGVILNNSSSTRTVMSGGTLDFGASEGIVTFNLRHQNNNGPCISSVIAGQNGLTLAGSGSDQDLVLGAANMYSGVTRLMAGCVSVSNANGFSAGDIYVHGNEGGGGQIRTIVTATITNGLHLAGVGGTPSGTPAGAVRFDVNGAFSGPVELMADTRVGTPTVTAVGTFSGKVYGPYGIEIGCPGQVWGKVRFGGVNTYSGTTLVSGGTLEILSGGTLGAGPVVNSATLMFSGSGDVTVTNAISGSGRVVQNGTGTLTLQGAYESTGLTDVNAGTLVVSGNPSSSNVVSLTGTLDLRGQSLTVGRLAGSGSVSNSAGGAVALTVGAGNADGLFWGAIRDGAGTTALNKIGSGTLTLGGLSAYSGATVVGEGTLRLQAAPAAAPTNGLSYRLDASVTNSFVFSGTNVSVWADVSGAGLAFTQALAHLQPVYVTNAINGLGAVRFNGLMTNRMAAAKSVGAQTVFIVNRTAGYQNLAGIWGCAGLDTGIRQQSATSWQLTGDQNDFTQGGEMFINGAAGNGFTASTQHVLTAVSATKRTWSTAIGDYWGNKDYRRSYIGEIGEILVYGSLLSGADRQAVEQYLAYKWMGAAAPVISNVLPVATALVVSNNAAFDLNGVSQAVGSLSGAGSVTSSSGAWSTLAVGGDNSSTAFSGVISGSNALVKVGSGTLTLSGASTYAGDTLVSGGTLRLAGGANRLPADSDVTVSAGATLDLNGQAQAVASIGGSGTVTGGALAVTDLIAPGGVGTVGMLTLDETPLLSSVALRIDTRLSGDCDVLAVSDDLDLAQLTLQLEDTAQMTGRDYVIATCSGALTGSFADTPNLPASWVVRYDRTPGVGQVVLLHNLGTLMLVK